MALTVKFMSKQIVATLQDSGNTKPSATPPNNVRPGIAYSYLHHLLEREKIQLARNLHDSFGQELTILRMGLAEIARATDDRTVKAQCTRLSKTVDKLIENVRSVSVDLYPSILEEQGLFPTLEWYFSRFERLTGLRCYWQQDGREPQIQPDKATQMFRIVQEALTNIVRHAQAKTVYVSTARKNGKFRMIIRDDGQGIAPETISDYRSFGLMNMKERARLTGGSLEISAAEGRGTLIRFEIPVQNCSAAFGTSRNQTIIQSLNSALAEQFRLMEKGNAIHKEIRELKRRSQNAKRRDADGDGS
jgi:signal transduction histidine kinase